MPALQNKKYFNYGGQGPLPSPSLEAINTSWQRIQELGPFTNRVWPYVTNEIESTRKRLAEISGITSNRIALTENVTTGCVLPLWGLPFVPGEHVLISDCEHPGVISACKELARRKQLQVGTLPIQHLRNGANEGKDTDQNLLNQLEVFLKPNTRLVVLSHLLWNTGQIIPIPAVAKRLSNHPNQPFLLVDAAQSFGHIPITKAASKADIYAFTGHKWACGPEGLGGVAISERVLKNADPTLIGWRSLQDEHHVNLDDADLFHVDGRRFEIATSCIPLLAGLRCSLDLFDKENTEIERLKIIQKNSEKLWIRLEGMDGVEPILSGPPPAGIVSFIISKEISTKEVVKRLGRAGLWLRDLTAPECLRACLHFTSEAKEIEELSQAIQKIALSY